MKSDRFADFATELHSEGDHYAAAIICFVGSMHVIEDRNSLGVLADIAEKIAERASRRYQRSQEELNAVEELINQL